MGINSIYSELFGRAEKIGIYNPRLNNLYIKSVKEISKKLKEAVAGDVIGYSKFALNLGLRKFFI
mgnify:FL=1